MQISSVAQRSVVGMLSVIAILNAHEDVPKFQILLEKNHRADLANRGEDGLVRFCGTFSAIYPRYMARISARRFSASSSATRQDLSAFR